MTPWEMQSFPWRPRSGTQWTQITFIISVELTTIEKLANNKKISDTELFYNYWFSIFTVGGRCLLEFPVKSRLLKKWKKGTGFTSLCCWRNLVFTKPHLESRKWQKQKVLNNVSLKEFWSNCKAINDLFTASTWGGVRLRVHCSLMSDNHLLLSGHFWPSTISGSDAGDFHWWNGVL